MEEFDRFDRQHEKLHQILWDENPLDRMYVYWLFNGARIKPAILENVTPFEHLEEYLQRMYGSQRYYVMIRRGRVMRFTGEIGIEQPRNFIPEKDIRLEIERLRRQKRMELISD